MDRWEGRVALVTGANSGIGAQISKSLVKSGLKVIGADKNIDSIESLAGGDDSGSISSFKCDLSNDDEIESLFKYIEDKYGRIDICVNCAGIANNFSLLGGDPEKWRKMLDINLLATCYCSKLSVDLMKKSDIDDGHIINIVSIMGCKVFSQPSHSHFYSVTKFGAKAFTDGLRMELRDAKSKIRVTSICPGLVKTRLLLNADYPADQVDEFYRQFPNWMEPKDIANAVLSVISTPANVQINDLIIGSTEELL